METWMVIQGVGAVGALLGLVGAVIAMRREKKALVALALLVAAVSGFVVLNATAFGGTPESDVADDFAEFDDPL